MDGRRGRSRGAHHLADLACLPSVGSHLPPTTTHTHPLSLPLCSPTPPLPCSARNLALRTGTCPSLRRRPPSRRLGRSRSVRTSPPALCSRRRELGAQRQRRSSVWPYSGSCLSPSSTDSAMVGTASEGSSLASSGRAGATSAEEEAAITTQTGTDSTTTTTSVMISLQGWSPYPRSHVADSCLAVCVAIVPVSRDDGCVALRRGGDDTRRAGRDSRARPPL